jgi:hypothetical protein
MKILFTLATMGALLFGCTKSSVDVKSFEELEGNYQGQLAKTGVDNCLMVKGTGIIVSTVGNNRIQLFTDRGYDAWIKFPQVYAELIKVKDKVHYFNIVAEENSSYKISTDLNRQSENLSYNVAIYPDGMLDFKFGYSSSSELNGRQQYFEFTGKE